MWWTVFCGLVQKLLSSHFFDPVNCFIYSIMQKMLFLVIFLEVNFPQNFYNVTSERDSNLTKSELVTFCFLTVIIVSFEYHFFLNWNRLFPVNKLLVNCFRKKVFVVNWCGELYRQLDGVVNNFYIHSELSCNHFCLFRMSLLANFRLK
jgi:hypothetical protein